MVGSRRRQVLETGGARWSGIEVTESGVGWAVISPEKLCMHCGLGDVEGRWRAR